MIQFNPPRTPRNQILYVKVQKRIHLPSVPLFDQLLIVWHVKTEHKEKLDLMEEAAAEENCMMNETFWRN